MQQLVWLILLVLLIGQQGTPQEVIPLDNHPILQIPEQGRRYDNGIRVMFYNVENLYDTHKDSLTDDNEFIPQGIRGWNNEKLQKKLAHISKVIIGVGGWEPPEIIGLSEVENRLVIYKLLQETPLKDFKYRIVHYNSPDSRGMDVALLYRQDKFRVLKSFPIHIMFPADTNSKTRDILYVKGRVLNRDTLHIFVNHWPSRFGGYAETLDKRNFVAGVLRAKVDSLIADRKNSKILIMGDFNDEPTDVSLKNILKAKLDSAGLQESDLYNQVGGFAHKLYHGTIKNRKMWFIFDQIIVSASLLNDEQGLRTTFHSAHIFNAPAIIQKDDAWLGEKPFRTYYGANYIGGFSDHLPVYTDLFF